MMKAARYVSEMKVYLQVVALRRSIRQTNKSKAKAVPDIFDPYDPYDTYL
jgi:hypothetical protein